MKRMKRWTAFLLALLMVFSLVPAQAMPVFADGILELTETVTGSCGEDLSWTLTTEGVLTISGSGEMVFEEAGAVGPWRVYAPHIKEVTIESGATSIAQNAFIGLENLEKVTIADSVTAIGLYAFSSCTALQEIEIPGSVQDIGFRAFWECSALETVTLNEGLMAIGGNAFSDCTSLTAIDIPDSVETLDWYAFSGCTALANVTLGSGLRTISGGVFGGCQSLTEITIPASVQTIEVANFSECYSLENIYVEAGNEYFSSVDGVLMSADEKTLFQCPAGKSGTYTIPESVETIADSAFVSCRYLEEILFSQNSAVTTIGWGAFSDCDNISEMIFPEGLEIIDNSIFDDCLSLTYVYIPASVYDIGDRAFWYANNLDAIEVSADNADYASVDGWLFNKDCDVLLRIPATIGGEVTLDEGIIAIGDYAFAGSNVSTLHLPETLESIGSRAFYNCAALENIWFYGPAPSIGDSVFAGDFVETEDGGVSLAVTATVNYPYGDDSYDSVVGNPYGGDVTWDAYGDDFAEITWSVEDGVLTVSGEGRMPDYNQEVRPWEDDGMITEIVVEEGITHIGRDAFSYMQNITKVTLPDSVTSIGQEAFSGCSRLTQVDLGQGVVEIAAGAFDWCWRLEQITLPASLEQLDCAFAGCSALEAIYVAEGNTDFCSVDGILFNMEKAKLIRYPSAMEGTSYTIPDTVTIVGERAFDCSQNLEEITLGSNVESIEGYAFNECYGLTEFTVTDTVKTLSNDVFCWCENLESLTLGSGLEYIGPGMLRMTQVTEITVPASVTQINIEAFNDAMKLTAIHVAEGNEVYCSVNGVLYDKEKTVLIRMPGGSDGVVEIPDTVTTVGAYAYSRNENIKSIVLPDSVTVIESCAFEDCYMATSLDLGNVITIGSGAFSWCGSLEKIVIPASVTEIGSNAFRECYAVKEIHFEGDAPTSIFDNAFTEVTATAYYPDGNETWTDAVMQDYGGTLNWVAKSGGTGEDGLAWTFSDGTLIISGSGAMADYTAENPAPWSNKAESITAVTVEAGVTYIGSQAFAGCENIETLVFQGAAPTFAEGVLENLEAAAYYPADNETWENAGMAENLFWRAYTGTCGASALWTLENGTLTIFGAGPMKNYNYQGAPWWSRAEEITRIVVEDGVTSVGDYAFHQCHQVVSASIGNSVKTIGTEAFWDCFELQSIALGDSVQTICDWAFENCNSLKQIILPTGVQTIEGSVFSGCNRLETITFTGDAPKSIADWAFNSVTATVYYLEGNETWTEDMLQDYGGDLTWVATVLGQCGENVSWILADGVLTISGSGEMANYTEESPAPWNSYADTITAVKVESGVASIGSNAFADCAKISTVVFAGDVPAFTENVFAGLNANGYYPSGNETWESADLDENLTWRPYMGTCGATAFWDYSDEGVLTIFGVGEMASYEYNNAPWYDLRESVTAIVVEDGITSISKHAFDYCYNAQTVTVGDDVVSIDAYAFQNCYNLKIVTLGSNVQSIGEYAFFDDDSLVEIILPASITELGNSVFNSCDSLEKIVFEGNPPSFSEETFLGLNTTTYYPISNENWTEDVLQDYGGSVTWLSLAGGSCGENLSWSINEGILTISGSGEMPDFTEEDPAPWSSYADTFNTVRVESGVTSIGSNAFAGCGSIGAIFFAGDMPAFAEGVFAGLNVYACYPAYNETWTVGELDSSITWRVGENSCGTDVYWSLEDGTLTIFGAGAMEDYESYGAPWSDRLEEIMQIVVEDGVTHVGRYSFHACHQAVSASIGDTVKTIGGEAFECSMLESLTLGNRVEEIDSYLLEGCDSIEEITLPASLKWIEGHVFSSSGLKRVFFEGNAPEYIDEYAFENMAVTAYYPADDETWTEEVRQNYGGSVDWKTCVRGTCGDGLSWLLDDTGMLTISGNGQMDDYTAEAPAPWHAEAEGITNVVVGSGVTSVGDYAFSGCTNLTEISFSGSAPAFGANAFDGVMATAYYVNDGTWTEDMLLDYGGDITWVSPDGICGEGVYWTLADGELTIFGNGAMENDYRPWEDQREAITSIVVKSGVTHIGNYVFRDCYYVQSVTLEEGIRTVGSGAFESCNQLTSITFPDSLTRIESSAFADCSALSQVRFGSGLQQINNHAFRGCSLVSVTLPASITAIEGGAFAYCHDLQNIYVEAGNERFYSEDGIVFSVYDEDVIYLKMYPAGRTGHYDVPANVRQIEGNAFDGAALSSVTIPDSVEYLNYAAFQECRNLTNVSLSSGITEIPNWCFAYCEALETITIPDNVTDIGSYAFHYSGLRQVEIGDGVTWIGNDAFSWSEELASIVIPESVTYIGGNTFSSCTGLTDIFFLGDAPGFDGDIFWGDSWQDGDEFYDYTVTATAYYPAGNETWTEDVLQNYGGNITWVPHENTIDCGHCGSNITWVLSKDGVLTFTGEGDMYDYAEGAAPWSDHAAEILQVVLSEGITSVSDSAFAGCENLAEVHFGGDAPVIPDHAFADVVADAYYIGGNPTWTEETLVGYGGTLNWIPINGYYQTHPIILSDLVWSEDGLEATTRVTVPAGSTRYYGIYDVKGMMLAVNNTDKGLMGGDETVPGVFCIINDMDVDYEYEVKVSWPVGSKANPESLSILAGDKQVINLTEVMTPVTTTPTPPRQKVF